MRTPGDHRSERPARHAIVFRSAIVVLGGPVLALLLGHGIETAVRYYRSPELSAIEAQIVSTRQQMVHSPLAESWDGQLKGILVSVDYSDVRFEIGGVQHYAAVRGVSGEPGERRLVFVDRGNPAAAYAQPGPSPLGLLGAWLLVVVAGFATVVLWRKARPT